MEEKKRTLLAVIISCIIMLAVIYSFGLNFFRPTPDVVVADPDLDNSQELGPEVFDEEYGIVIEVTPETVQSVIASMSRYQSYRRTVEIGYYWGGDRSSTVSAEIWTDGGWTRCDALLTSGLTEHSILGGGSLWYWYDESTEYLQVPDSGGQEDLIQYVPTYEDVLQVEQTAIRETGYVEKNGGPCIFVEVQRDDYDYLERYWISVTSGLLAAAETRKDGVVVYSMTSGDIVSPLGEETAAFALPDGTILHQPKN